MNEFFSRMAQWASRQSGRAHTFMAAIVLILAWGATGPLFGFSDTWQLVINTGTTIVTFLMVFPELCRNLGDAVIRRRSALACC